MLERSLKRRYQTPTEILQALSGQPNRVNPTLTAKVTPNPVQQFPIATSSQFETFLFQTAQLEFVTEVKQGWFRKHLEVVPKIRRRSGQAERLIEMLPNGVNLEMVRIP